MMLGAGENLLWVSTQMGHESSKQTLDAYARWIPDNDINARMKATEAYEFRPEI
jgi:integrase